MIGYSSVHGRKYVTIAFVLVLLLCVFNACRKKENDIVKGSVVANEKPIPGIHVQLQYWKVGNSSNPTYYKDVNADADGKFAIPIDFKIGYLYQLNVNLPDHYGVEGYRVSRNVGCYIQLYTFAYVKLRVIKTGNQNNKIEINSADFKFSSAATAPYDTTLSIVNRVRGGQEMRINWSVTDKSLPAGPQNPNELLGVFKVAPAETYVYTIRYE